MTPDVDPDQAEARRIEARRWFAVLLATAVMFMSYLLYIFGFASVGDEEPVFAGGLLGIAIGLTPMAFFAAAAASRHASTFRAVFAGLGLFVVIGLPIAIVDIPTGLVAGFGAGGVVALNRLPPATIGYRIAAVVTCVVYVAVVRLIIPPAGLMVGAVVPFATVALADVIRGKIVEEPAASPI